MIKFELDQICPSYCLSYQNIASAVSDKCMVEMKMMKNKKDENQLLKVMSMIKMTTYDENAVNINNEL